MPIQAPQWTDYLNCPVCCREFGVPPRSPISLSCGHTVCKHCLTHLHRRQCPFDQTLIQVEPEELVVNTALLQLVGCATPSKPYHPPCVQAATEREKQAYDVIVQRMEELATFLKYCSNAAGTSQSNGRLSRPMQRKLVTLVQCSITDEEGRGKAARAARSLGERTVTELILQHQNPQQLSANLWAAVRARGCQFLGPAMQEEVLKLVLLALEDGSALSRKVLVMFVVQRLEPHFPQASKTSIGHVVQLLYRASCFKVSKRQCDSSLMELKEEFRAYPALRREHDAQIVQIATEAGLRIAPDQWSALLYGDTAHKSHMQSIIDKLQTPQSFAQSVQELFIVLQRTSDPAQLAFMNKHLERLANIEVCPDAKGPSWVQLADILTALKEVVSGLISYQQSSVRDNNQNAKHTATLKPLEASNNDQGMPQTVSPSSHGKYNNSPCCNPSAGRYCHRGPACQFAQIDDEIERFQPHQSEASNNMVLSPNGNVRYLMPRMVTRIARPTAPLLPPAPLYSPYRISSPPHPANQQHANYNNMLTQQNNMPQVMPTEYLEKPVDILQPNYYIQQGIANSNEHLVNVGAGLKHNMLPMMELKGVEQPQMQNYYNIGGPYVLNVGQNVPSQNYQSSKMQVPIYQGQEGSAISRSVLVPLQPDINIPSREISPYAFDDVQSDLLSESYQAVAAGRYGHLPRDIRTSPTWLPADDIFNFDGLRTNIPSTDDVFNVGVERMAVRPTTFSANAMNNTDNELEEEIQELERCLDKVLDK